MSDEAFEQNVRETGLGTHQDRALPKLIEETRRAREAEEVWSETAIRHQKKWASDLAAKDAEVERLANVLGKIVADADAEHSDPETVFFSYKARAERAEAEVARLRAALEEALNRMNFDSDFIGRKHTREIDIAREALEKP